VTGNAAYAAARRRALARTGDPQTARPAAPAPRTPAPCEPCRCSGDDPLPHLGMYHHLASAVPRGKRTWRCSIGTAAGWCPCTEYAASDPGAKLEPPATGRDPHAR
jgi:hypothetical protein